MIINDLELRGQELPLLPNQQNDFRPNVNTPNFSDTLNDFIKDVNSLQKESAEQSERFVKGEPVELHDVMIAAEKARTSFQLLLELRNKALDLYREVMRLQV